MVILGEVIVPLEFVRAVLVSKGCRISWLAIDNVGLGVLFLFRGAHARLHAALELDGPGTFRVCHAHAHALGKSLLNVVVDAFFGKSGRCLLRVHVD